MLRTDLILTGCAVTLASEPPFWPLKESFNFLKVKVSITVGTMILPHPLVSLLKLARVILSVWLTLISGGKQDRCTVICVSKVVFILKRYGFKRYGHVTTSNRKP